MGSVEHQIGKVIDDVLQKRERALPRWAVQRLTRLFHDLESDAERERVRDRYSAHAPALAEGLHRVAESGSAPSIVSHVVHATQPTRGRTFKGRELRLVPDGTIATYQDMVAAIRGPFMILGDGRQFSTPTPAAEHVNGGTEVNGWEVWKVHDGRSLAECYDSRDWP